MAKFPGTPRSPNTQGWLVDWARYYWDKNIVPIPLCHPRHEDASYSHLAGRIDAQTGKKIEPCRSPGKAPLLARYQLYARDIPDWPLVESWFKNHMGNLGCVVPAGGGVIDVDPRARGDDSLYAYEEKYGELPLGARTITGGGGIHIWLRLRPEHKLKAGGSLAEKGFPGLEWKAAGANVVMPPSIHASGHPYSFEFSFEDAKASKRDAMTSKLDAIYGAIYGAEA